MRTPATPSPASTVVPHVPAITRPSNSAELVNSSSRSTTAALAVFDTLPSSARAVARLTSVPVPARRRDDGDVAQRRAALRGEIGQAERQRQPVGADLGLERRRRIEARRARLIAHAGRQEVRHDDVRQRRPRRHVADRHGVGNEVADRGDVERRALVDEQAAPRRGRAECRSPARSAPRSSRRRRTRPAPARTARPAAPAVAFPVTVDGER